MPKALYLAGKISVFFGRPLLVFLAFSFFPGYSSELAILLSVSAIAIASSPPLHMPLYAYRYQSDVAGLDLDIFRDLSSKYLDSLLVSIVLISVFASSISYIILKARGLEVIPFILAFFFFCFEKIHDEVNRFLLVSKSFTLWGIVTLSKNLLPLILFSFYLLTYQKFLSVALPSFQVALALIAFTAFSTLVAFLIFLSASPYLITRFAPHIKLSSIFSPRMLVRFVLNKSRSLFSAIYLKPWISNLSNLPVTYSDRLLNLALPSELISPFFIAITISSLSTYTYDTFVITRRRQEIISLDNPSEILKVIPSLIVCSSVAILITFFYQSIHFGVFAYFQLLFLSIPLSTVLLLLFASLFMSISGLLLEWIYWRRMFRIATLLNAFYICLLAVVLFSFDLTLLSTSIYLFLLSLFRFLSIAGSA